MSDVRGRERFESPVESCENREGPWAREAVSIASRILVSSFLAIISAAFPFGARIMGTWPSLTYVSVPVRRRLKYDHVPIVATTLNNPRAIRSISASMSCSDDEGELRIWYDESG